VDAPQKPVEKKPYNSPQLTVYGPIQVLTRNRNVFSHTPDNTFNPQTT
jgi:hypothetical protein